MERKLKEHICTDCGATFYSVGEIKRTVCEECKKKRLKQKHKPASEKNKTLFQIMVDIEAYNKKHGTHLTYGQYSVLTQNKKSGKI